MIYNSVLCSIEAPLLTLMVRSYGNESTYGLCKHIYPNTLIQFISRLENHLVYAFHCMRIEKKSLEIYI